MKSFHLSRAILWLIVSLYKQPKEPFSLDIMAHSTHILHPRSMSIPNSTVRAHQWKKGLFFSPNQFDLTRKKSLRKLEILNEWMNKVKQSRKYRIYVSVLNVISPLTKILESMSHNKCCICLKMIFAYFDKWKIGGRKRKSKVNKKLLHPPLLSGTGDGPELHCSHKLNLPFTGFFLSLLSFMSALFHLSLTISMPATIALSSWGKNPWALSQQHSKIIMLDACVKLKYPREILKV